MAPSCATRRNFSALAARRTQTLNRALQEAGIFVMRDDPQGRRYGYRDPKTGRITKAFGFDLSLLMERHEEFKKIAAEAQIERNRMKKLRQQKTLARKAIAQAAEELDAQGYDSEALQCLLQEAAELVKAGSQCDRSDELALAVQALERRRDEIQRMLSDLIKPVETSPMGAENDTHSTSTTLIDNDINHTVIAAKDCSRAGAPPVPNDQGQSKPKHLFPETLHITPATLVELAPRLAPYMPARTNDKDWPAIVEAALYLSGEMGINRTLWARACDVMGREYAAVAMADRLDPAGRALHQRARRVFRRHAAEVREKSAGFVPRPHALATQGRDLGRPGPQRAARTEKARGDPSREPAMTPVGGFMPVGTVLHVAAIRHNRHTSHHHRRSLRAASTVGNCAMPRSGLRHVPYRVGTVVQPARTRADTAALAYSPAPPSALP